MENLQDFAPDFVSKERRSIVDGLLNIYDQVNAGKGPRLVSLEAPAGWGKTRITQEFYARLALERQYSPPYWPPTLSGEPSEITSALNIHRRRKSLNPDMHHQANALPAYLWWGIRAGMREGVASISLAHDVLALRMHAPFLQDARNRLVGFRKRNLKLWTKTLIEMGPSATQEVFQTAIQTAVGATIPGLGVLEPLFRSIHDSQQQAWDRTIRANYEGPLIDDRFELLDETLKALEQLACPGLPFIIVVEDAHDADPVLAALLEDIMKTDASVLILLTAWNGYVDSNLGISAVLAEAPSKTFRISPTTYPFPPPFPFDASFSALRSEELAPLIRRYYPQVADSTAKEVASHFPNPLALELFLQMRVQWDQNSPSSPSIESLELSTVPTELHDLYREQWNRLPKEDQRALAFASAGTLSSLSGSDQAPATWNASFLETALAKMLLSNPRQIETTINDSKHFAAWSTPVSDHIQQFTDQYFHEVVRQDNSQLGTVGRSDFLTKLGVAVSEAVFKDDFPDLETKRHSLQLAVSLKKLGFVDEHTATRANQLLVLSAYDKSELVESLQDNDADRQTQAATMGKWGPTRELFTLKAPALYPAFNSITNNPAYGDERALFRMKPSDAPSSEYSSYLDIVPGKRYTGLIYFHNNAHAAHLAMEGAKMRVALPDALLKTKVNGATAFLEAANATPPRVYGNVYFRTPRDVAVRYVPDSATFHSFGPLDKEHMDGRQLLRHGHLLGYDRFDGILPGGKPAQAAGFVTFEIQTHYPDFTVKLRMRRLGTSSWDPVIVARPGDEIEIYLAYQNTGTVPQNNVVARIALPDSLTYVPGTTEMINSIVPEGEAQPDGIVRQGLNIGSYAPRGNCGIKFMTTLAPDSTGKDLSVYATMITAHGNKQAGFAASVRVR